MAEPESEEKAQALPLWKQNLELYYPKEIYGDEELFDDQGVDLTGVRFFLDKSPAERIRTAQEVATWVRQVWELNGLV